MNLLELFCWCICCVEYLLFVCECVECCDCVFFE